MWIWSSLESLWRLDIFETNFTIRQAIDSQYLRARLTLFFHPVSVLYPRTPHTRAYTPSLFLCRGKIENGLSTILVWCRFHVTVEWRRKTSTKNPVLKLMELRRKQPSFWTPIYTNSNWGSTWQFLFSLFAFDKLNLKDGKWNSKVWRTSVLSLILYQFSLQRWWWWW